VHPPKGKTYSKPAFHKLMKLLTLARDLGRRKARERDRLFVAEGVRTVEELIRSPVRIRGALVAPSLTETPRGAALAARLTGRVTEVATVTDREFRSAAQTESPQGILAIGEIPDSTLSDLAIPSSGRVLVLDALQDPGNVGTILRTAAALGVIATISLPGTVDLWNAKVVRSAMGAQFHHPSFRATWGELDPFLRERSVAVWGTDPAGEPPERGDAPDRLALVLGNEGAGLGDEARRRCARLIGIPITGTVESLNVAVAAGILLYTLRA
jgi:TrmH family RNA methyltransferase